MAGAGDYPRSARGAEQLLGESRRGCTSPPPGEALEIALTRAGLTAGSKIPHELGSSSVSQETRSSHASRNFLYRDLARSCCATAGMRSQRRLRAFINARLSSAARSSDGAQSYVALASTTPKEAESLNVVGPARLTPPGPWLTHRGESNMSSADEGIGTRRRPWCPQRRREVGLTQAGEPRRTGSLTATTRSRATSTADRRP